MSIKYKNFCEIIRAHGCSVIMTEEEFKEDGVVKYDCKHGHMSTMTSASFANKSSPKKLNNCRSLCGECNEYLSILDKVTQKANILNFQILELLPDKKHVIYRCSCGAEHRCEVNGICRSSRTSTCPSCQRSSNRKQFSDIQNKFAERGCRLLSREKEYENNMSRLQYICSCGQSATITYHDFASGRLCMACSADRRLNTKSLIRKTR